MTTETTTPTTPETDAQIKQPRARWSEAMVLRLTANKAEGSAALVLLTGLVSCNIAHKTIDNALHAPEGTVLAYLKAGAAQHWVTKNADGAEVEHVLDDAAADRLIDDLVALKLADAFTPRGLDLAAVLSVLLNKGQLSR